MSHLYCGPQLPRVVDLDLGSHLNWKASQFSQGASIITVSQSVYGAKWEGYRSCPDRSFIEDLGVVIALCWTVVLDCLVVVVVIVLRLMQTRSSGYRSRIHIIPDMRAQSFPSIKGALVIKPFLEANSFPALVGHMMSHSISHLLCVSDVQIVISSVH